MDNSYLISTEMLGAAEKYWTGKFSQDLQELNLIGDYSKSNEYVEKRENMVFSEKMSGELIAISKRDDLSLFVVLLTLYKILLFKITNRHDIVVLSPVLKESKQKFNDVVALRDCIRPEMTFKELIMNVKQTVVNGYRYQFFPLRKIIESKKKRDDALFFKVILILENIHKSSRVNDSIAENKNEILLSIRRDESKLNGGIVYNSKLFAKETIAQFYDCFLSIAKQVLHNTAVKISDIEMIEDEMRQVLLYEFNNTKTAYPADKTVHGIFAEQVEKEPAHTAVVFEDEHITYRALAGRSTKLAFLLREKGISVNCIAGLMLARSLEMIVGIFAVLKAGGAYLPIDPGYPDERIMYILKDSSAGLLLTRDTYLSRVQVTGGIKTVDVGTAIREEAKENIERMAPAAHDVTKRYSSQKNILHKNKISTSNSIENRNSSTDLANVIYTSGTMGKPKGIMIEHYNIIRLVKKANYIEYFPGDRLLLTGALGFDITTFEVMAPLLNGISLHLIGMERMLHIGGLEETVIKSNISILHLTPQFFNEAAVRIPDMFEHLRCFLVGGDEVSLKYINDIRERYPGLHMIHMYGPTENTTFSTSLTVERTYGGRLPIGKPVNNSTVYIVGSNRKLQPVGIPGELCSGGEGVSRGYLNMIDLTSEKFTGDPFVKGGRFYHTGDLARWLPCGDIEFLGRLDNQVKIRGFRIELSEIQNRLLVTGDIKDAVVIVKENMKGDRYLCAYVVRNGTGKQTGEAGPGENDLLDIPGLKRTLSEFLPDYMIPSHFEEVENIPLTTNGKVDRHALPEPKIAGAKNYEAPANEFERKVVGIWSELLDIEEEKISVTDNFFIMGGNSLKAIQLFSVIKKSYGVEIPLLKFFDESTVRSLCNMLRIVNLIDDRIDILNEEEEEIIV